ncbi:hypothetical protein [Leptolyngbya sp. FACHB-261]|uniref:hypothetical protein n=1 Tax=Leptolyngbya sp. FACHB-261 TaxID=2692806 RepID=UPI00168596B2|nr:hypothetical protein [Leptolyngbya sp. FACHB-261]MBD2102698.1 hypothetical protein [Leptolyngbya sp. FACHB-261]
MRLSSNAGYIPNPSEKTVEQLADQIIKSGKITRADQRRFVTTLLSSGSGISEAQRLQINRVFEHLQAGKLRVVD